MPTKPTRIKHSALAILFNDIQLDRGTSFGCTGALNTEEIREIGNIGIVEILDGIPTVDATCDTNEYGSIKTIAALANKKFDYGYVQARPHASSGHWVTVILVIIILMKENIIWLATATKALCPKLRR